MNCHQKLVDSKEDQLALASIHFQGGHHQEVIFIYEMRLKFEMRYLMMSSD